MVPRPPDSDPVEQGEEPYRRADRLVKCALVIVVLATGLSGVAVWISSTRSAALCYADNISAAEQRRRIDMFNALRALPLEVVSAADMPKAIDSMNLSPVAAGRLSARCGLPHGYPAHVPYASDTPNVLSAAEAAEPVSQVARLAHEALAERLAWITLWDSDRVDGDAVGIESGEYSRTVMLTKEGTTFAIPIPVDCKIRFAGLRDGDGGGITVGVASGAAGVLLPIMKLGDVLTLDVKDN